MKAKKTTLNSDNTEFFELENFSGDHEKRFQYWLKLIIYGQADLEVTKSQNNKVEIKFKKR